MRPALRGSRVTRIAAGGVVAWLLLASAGMAIAAVPGAPAAGPPYPPPQRDVVVYDYADVFTSQTESSATAIIVAIEERVGAEIVVYTQYKPGSTTESTERDAMALIDQWGVGRAGFDDGLAILFNMNRTICLPGAGGNGQVQLYAGPGYAATFLSNAERQRVFDEEMAPLLRECEMDDALLVGLGRVNENATPEHARTLALARTANAVVGLIVAPVVFLLLVGAAGRSWLLYGRDPVYLDSPSILMPAPPPDLTAAAGAVVWEGRATRRALTTALLDLASRGEISFRAEDSFLGRDKAGINIESGESTDPYVIRNRRRPIGAAEEYALARLRGLAGESGDYVDPTELQGFAQYVAKFDERLERHVAQHGWFREPPQKAVRRWSKRGWLAIFGGIGVAVLGGNLPSDGLVLLGVALGAAGVVMNVLARVMPARTMAGAMVYAMLAAYRRTLQKTMAQARSMQQVVDEARLDWLETPDQAIVWGVALGLHEEVESVLERSVQDLRSDPAGTAYVPSWYGSTASSPGRAGSVGYAPGLFSSSAVPNFGGMMATLGAIGNAPGGSGSGGFGGGSSGGGGGGGGGAGGGF